MRDEIEARALEILADSKKWTQGKQRLTASRLHELLVGEHFEVGYTTVKVIVREWKRQRREVFIPLVYRPGDLAEVDFFEVFVVIQGARRKAYLFLMRLMHSGRDFAWLYDRQDQVSFLDAHVRAFAHFDGVPARAIYDNLRAAVVKVLIGAERQLSERFAAMVAHYAIEPCFARPMTGHDKGGVEARGRAIRLQELVPIPEGQSLDEINRALLDRLDSRIDRVLDAEGRSIADRFVSEQERFMPVPEFPFRAVKTIVCTVSSRSLIRIEGAWYSVPRDWARLDVVAHVGATEIEVVGRSGSVRHPRRRSGQRSIDYRHYLPDLARKPQALRQVAPELVAEMGEPYAGVWARLCDTHGPKEAARAFAKVLQYLEDHGHETTSLRLEEALRLETPILIALRPPAIEERQHEMELPAVFTGIEVESAVVADFDRLLGAAS